MMQEIELKVGSTSIKLGCEDKEKLLSLTNALNKKIEKIKTDTKVSDIKALVINSIYLMDEINLMKKDIEELRDSFCSDFNKEKEKLKNHYNELANNIENIAKQLEVD